VPYNLFLLPLLGGFLFLRKWNPTKYHALRAEAERLLILASIVGLITLVIAFLLMRLSQYVPYLPEITAWWNHQVPFDYLGTSLFAFTLGALGHIPLNWLPFCSDDRAIDQMIEHDRIPLKRLLKKAFDENKTVSVTMSSGKIYVGFVTHLLNPGLPTTFIEILPTKSGYRDEADKTVTYTTFYTNVLDQLSRSYETNASKLSDAEARRDELAELPPDNLTKKQLADRSKQVETLHAEILKLDAELALSADIANDFGVVLPVCEIHSISIYREEVQTELFAPSGQSTLTLVRE
jgi:hypothetical protein